MANTTEIEVLNSHDLTKHRGNVKEKIELRKYLEKDAIRSILSQIPAGKQKMLILTLWMTGLRVSEVIQIRKKDIDVQNTLLTVRWLKNRKYKERIVPIKQELAQMLDFYTTNMAHDAKVFPYTRQWVYQVVDKYFGTSPHTLRHSFAVNFLRQSKSPTAFVILKRLLGHSKIDTTMEYLKLVPMDMAEELNKIEF